MGYLVWAFILVPIGFAFASPVSENRQGNKNFEKGKYAEAAGHYKKAEIEAPERKELSYNLANTYYRGKNYDEALKSYDRARTAKDPELRKRAWFNRGNALYRSGSNPQDQAAQQKLEQAVQSYREVLKLDPRDNPAKFNLQKTLELIQQMKQQQQQQKNQDSSGNKNQDKNQKQQQDQSGKDQKEKQDEQQKQDQKNQEQEKKEQQKNAQQNKEEQKPGEQKAQAAKPGEMSEEEAKRLLDAMKQDESNMQKRLMRMKIPGRGLDKDW